MLFFVFSPSFNGGESCKTFSDPNLDLHQNLINSSSSHTQPVHQISAESVPNFLRYTAHKQPDRGENITSPTFSGGGKDVTTTDNPETMSFSSTGNCVVTNERARGSHVAWVHQKLGRAGFMEGPTGHLSRAYEKHTIHLIAHTRER